MITGTLLSHTVGTGKATGEGGCRGSGKGVVSRQLGRSHHGSYDTPGGRVSRATPFRGI